MNVYSSPFELIPKVRLNRHSQLRPMPGVYLRSDSEFAEYFPHQALGDESVDEFMASFPDPTRPYHLKILEQLFRKAPALRDVPFHNHQLWRSGEPLLSPVIKYKLLHEQDYGFRAALAQQVRVRLDANALFSPPTFEGFRQKLRREEVSLIDYIEDPLPSLQWNSVNLPCAQDFIPGTPCAFKIYKPNRSSRGNSTLPQVFSGNMGSPLATLQAYQELEALGDLGLTHGILTPGLFQHEIPFFTGDYFTGFRPILEAFAGFTKALENRQWSYLCTI